MFDLAIIGVGATTVSLLKQLQDEVYVTGLSSLRIALFCPAEYFARGKAFGDAEFVHKVNTPPRMLCISEREPDGFSRWMVDRYGSLEPYPSRRMYSEFLRETYQRILDSGILLIEEFHAEVDSVLPFRGGYKLSATNKCTMAAKKVVMCLGSLHGESFPNLAMQRGFVDHYSQIPDIPEGPVLIAGSGLTAVDFARSLSINKNREIHFFSRRGYAPTCLTSKNNYTPTLFNWDGLVFNKKYSRIQIAHFINLLKQERDRLPGRGEVDPALHILRKQGAAQYFDYLMTRSAAADLPCQDILVSTRFYMHKVWQSISIKEKILFNSNYGSAWASWRHPIPYEVISDLKEIAREGRLYIHKSRHAPSHENGEFIIKTDAGRLIKSHFMVDGTGGSSNLKSIGSPLLNNLLQQKLIESHPCGGMHVHPLTFQCMVHDKPVQNLYNIGPLSKGSLFSTNAFWFNAQCAGQWARQYVIEMVKKNLHAA